MTDPISDLLLEQLLCADLPEAQRVELERRVALDPSAQARLDALREDNQALLARYPSSIQAEQIRARLPRPRVHQRARARQLLAASALLALLALWAPAVPVSEAPHEVADTVRIKGAEPELRVFRQREGRAERLAVGARARAGDVLQLGWRARRGQYIAILSIDGRGVVTRHWPPRAEQSAPMACCLMPMSLMMRHILNALS
jgi:hypothetical protein